MGDGYVYNVRLRLGVHKSLRRSHTEASYVSRHTAVEDYRMCEVRERCLLGCVPKIGPFLNVDLWRGFGRRGEILTWYAPVIL